MRILFLTDNFPPEVNAPANRTYEHCVEWVAMGAKVTVITCAPNFPQGKVYAGYKNKLWQVEQIDGVRVVRVWSYISPNKGFMKRTLDFVSFAVSAFFASLFVKADLIVATSPQFFTAMSGYSSALIKRKPWVMEVRDLWPESIKAVGAMKDGRYFHWLEKLELFLYRNAVKVVVVTASFKHNIIAKGIPSNKIEVVQNGVKLEQAGHVDKSEALKEKLDLGGKFVVSYIGTHGMAHGLDFILRCAKQVPDDVHFLLVGDGAEKENLLRLHTSLDLRNVTMLPPIPKKQINEYIALSDVALVNLIKSDTFKTVIPSKIFENAAMRKPILLGVEGESEGIIRHYGAGACFEPGNQEDFLEKLELLRQNRIFYLACQAGCQQLAEDFNRQKLAAKMFHIFCDLLGEGRPAAQDFEPIEQAEING